MREIFECVTKLITQAVETERISWFELTKNHRHCGELLRVVTDDAGVPTFYCKPCGATWKLVK
jgi:hypothetical protein